MISTIDFYNSVNEQMSTNNSRFIGKEEFERTVNIVQEKYFKDLVGGTSARVDGRTRVGYGNNQDSDNRLKPFRDSKVIQVLQGVVSLDSNIYKLTSVSNVVNNKPLKRLDEDRLGSIHGNVLREPNEDDIYYTEVGGDELEIFGLVDRVRVRYLKQPRDIKIGMKKIEITVGERTVIREEPDPDTTVNLEWRKSEYSDLLNRVVNMLSTPIKDVFLDQKTERNKLSE